MKPVSLFALLCLSVSAWGLTTVKETPGTHDLYTGSKKTASFPDHASCVAGAASAGASSVKAATFTCRNTTTIVVTNVAGPKPPDEQRTVACPAGSAQGSVWVQTRTYLSARAPVFWSPTPWSPLAPLPAECPPPPPPPTMHMGLDFDPATVPVGIQNPGTLLDMLTVDPPVFPSPSPDGTGDFRTVVLLSHYIYDDPVVHPGKPGESHLHAMFNNTSTNANSTVDSLLAAPANGRGGAINHSAYWMPALQDITTKALIQPDALIVYYKSTCCSLPKDNLTVQPMPLGLKMLAGDPSATAAVQWGPTGFDCDGGAFASDHEEPFIYGQHRLPTLAECGVGHVVRAGIAFPNCWDGKNLDSPDHRSHMAYPQPGSPLPGACPADHPVQLPQLAFGATFTVKTGMNPGNWAFASDTYKVAHPEIPGGLSLHGDYFGAWRPEIAATWAKFCNAASMDCGASMLGDGRVMQEFGGN